MLKLILRILSTLGELSLISDVASVLDSICHIISFGLNMNDILKKQYVISTRFKFNYEIKFK